MLTPVCILLKENAYANSSYGVLSLQEGLLSIGPLGLLITILLESLIIYKMLKLNFQDSFWSALLANIGSTVIGLIVAFPFYLTYSIIFVVTRGGLNDLFLKPQMITEPYISLYGNWFAWQIVEFWVYFAVCFLLSYDSEGIILQKLNKSRDKKVIFKASFYMNSISYFLLFVYFSVSGIGYGETKLTLLESIKYLLTK